MVFANDNICPILKKYYSVAKTIAEMFGKKCEVLIYDFRNLKHSIVAIENGHVTGLGCRYHPHCNQRRLALSDDHHGSLFP